MTGECTAAGLLPYLSFQSLKEMERCSIRIDLYLEEVDVVHLALKEKVVDALQL